MPDFSKSERLCGQIRIKALYSGGQKFVCWPLRVTYKPSQETQVLIWAPKSLFKHAVDRNQLRRLMREAYRLNKEQLQGQTYQLAFNYMDKQIQPYATIERAMVKALKKINHHE